MPKRDAQGIDVAMMPDVTAPNLLGRHVVGRSADSGLDGDRRIGWVVVEASQTKIGNLHERYFGRQLSTTGRFGQDKISRLDISVDDPLLVGVVQSMADLKRDMPCMFFGKLILLGQIFFSCLLYTSPSPRDATLSRMPSSA